MFKENRTDTVEVTHLYSHSVVYGNSMCDGETKILSYYSSLWLYLGWMVGVVGRPMLVFTGEEVEYWNNTRIGSVVNPNMLGNPSGTNIVTGNLYPVQRAMVVGTNSESASSSDTSESASGSGASESDTETSSSFSDDVTEKDNTGDVNSDFDDVQDSRGLSKKAKIAIGVAVPVAVIIIIIVCVAVVVMKRKSEDKSKDWDPQGEENQLRTAALELCLEYPQATPPPYSGDGISDAINTESPNDTKK
ncbi:hypothetical protein LPJ59_004739 [Coemansia sp. RSA 2399]|nr:hypothetical protein LPJ59_004739 [Coemansia sp. RSA 2399]KAJ1893626.1 hypothetical protein LPJ81_005338 [Coemansia sp. IMI 209127]